jgi:hypothetical protein
VKKLAAIARGLLSDPYVCVTVGSLLLLRGLDSIAATAKQLQTDLATVQQQYVAMAQAAASNGPAVFHEAKPEPQPAPDVAGLDL